MLHRAGGDCGPSAVSLALLQMLPAGHTQQFWNQVKQSPLNNRNKGGSKSKKHRRKRRKTKRKKKRRKKKTIRKKRKKGRKTRRK